MKSTIAATLLAVVAPLSGEEMVLLPPVYQTGRDYELRSVQHVETVMAMDPRAGVQKQVADLGLDLLAECSKSKTHPGMRDVTLTLKKIVAELDLGGLKMTYDSSAEGSGETVLGETFQNLVDKAFTLTLSDTNEIVAVSGMEQFVTGNNPLSQQLGPEQLKRIALPALNLGIPEEGARMGDRWEHERRVDFGPGVGLNSAFQVKYTGDVEEDGLPLAKLEYTATMDVDAETSGGEADPRVKIEVRDARLRGSMLMDNALRFPRSAEGSMEFTVSAPNPVKPGERLELPVKQSMRFELVETRKRGLLGR